MNAARTELSELIKTMSASPTEILQRRKQIAQAILDESPNVNQPNFQSMAASDIRFLMSIYDQVFFDELCSLTLNENRDEINFRVSNRMTSAGGKTTVESSGKRRKATRHVKFFPKRKIEIAISSVLLFGTQFDSISEADSRITVAGVKCVDRLDAFLRIFEHELIHLVEFLIWDDSSCSARRFRDISRRFFDHRQSSHQLITPSESAEQLQGIGIGDCVGFKHAGQKHVGYVNHINRRATVLVPSRSGTQYADGKRYAKYYVPLTRLQRVKVSK